MSGLLDFKIKFDSKMTGEKKKLIIAKICSYEKLTKEIYEGCA